MANPLRPIRPLRWIGGSRKSYGGFPPRLIGWIAIVLLLALLAACVNYFVRADLLLNRIDRYIAATSGGLDRHFSLVPEVFRVGQPMGEVKAELEAAGYRAYADGIFVHDGETIPDNPVVYGKEGGSGLTRLICSIDFLVVLDPAEDDTIRSAAAHVQSACL